MGLSVTALAHEVALHGYPYFIALVLLGAAGAPLPVEAAIIAVGALSATRGGPDFLLLALAGTAAAIAGDLLDYGVARAGTPLLKRWRARLKGRFGVAAGRLHGSSLARASVGLWRNSSWMILLSRFLFVPLGRPINFVAGVTHIPLRRFLTLDVLGEAIFLVVNLWVGWLLGPGLTTTGPLLVIFWTLLGLVTIVPLVLVPLEPLLLGRHPSREVAPDEVPD